MGFFSYLFNINKWNADPTQQKISRMLVDVVEGRGHATDIVEFIQERDWPEAEQLDRLTHALSVVKVSRGDLYGSAQEVYRQVGWTLKERPVQTARAQTRSNAQKAAAVRTYEYVSGYRPLPHAVSVWLDDEQLWFSFPDISFNWKGRSYKVPGGTVALPANSEGRSKLLTVLRNFEELWKDGNQEKLVAYARSYENL